MFVPITRVLLKVGTHTFLKVVVFILDLRLMEWAGVFCVPVNTTHFAVHFCLLFVLRLVRHTHLHSFYKR